MGTILANVGKFIVGILIVIGILALLNLSVFVALKRTNDRIQVYETQGFMTQADVDSELDNRLVNNYHTKDEDNAQFALKSEIPSVPDVSVYALKSDIPAATDMSVYALKSDIPAATNLSGYVTVQDLEAAQTRPLTMTVISGGNSQIITYTLGTTQGLVLNLDSMGFNTQLPAGTGYGVQNANPVSNTVIITQTSVPATGTPAAAVQPAIVQPTTGLTVTGNFAQIKLIAPGGVQLQSSPPSGSIPNVQSTNPTCRDGETIGVQQNDLQRTPIGLGEDNSVMQLSWKGDGFGGFNRAVVVSPLLINTHQVFFVDGETAVMTRHCGDTAAVAGYASQTGSYITAMKNTASDTKGNTPEVPEIGVFLIDLNGQLVELVPSSTYKVDELAAHLEIVKLQQ